MVNDIIMRTEHISRILDTEALPVTLVKDASVELRTHEFTAIKGPSGSGKSSLLYLLGLLDKPTSGNIFIDDIDVIGLSDKKLAQIRLEQMGFVFQFHFLKVAEQFLLPCSQELQLLAEH
jgi:lipoprotein-releasing system ATP-binding protein